MYWKSLATSGFLDAGRVEQRMTTNQIILFALLVVVFALLIWGRWRYDLVAFLALLVAILTGVVPNVETMPEMPGHGSRMR